MTRQRKPTDPVDEARPFRVVGDGGGQLPRAVDEAGQPVLGGPAGGVLEDRAELVEGADLVLQVSQHLVGGQPVGVASANHLGEDLLRSRRVASVARDAIGLSGDPQVVGFAPSGCADVQPLLGGVGGDECVAPVYSDALGPVGGDGVGKVRVSGEVVGREYRRVAVSVSSDHGGAARVTADHGPTVTVGDPPVGGRADAPVVAAGDDVISQTGLVVHQHHTAIAVYEPQPHEFGLGPCGQLGGLLVGGGNHQYRSAAAVVADSDRIGSPCGE